MCVGMCRFECVVVYVCYNIGIRVQQHNYIIKLILLVQLYKVCVLKMTAVRKSKLNILRFLLVVIYCIDCQEIVKLKNYQSAR